MRVTYHLSEKGSDTRRISIGAMSLAGTEVTIEGTIEEVKQLTEYLEQKYSLI
jgi:hypothetical protein